MYRNKRFQSQNRKTQATTTTTTKTNEVKYILLFHLSFFGFLFRVLAFFVVGKFIRAQVFEQHLESTTIKTRIELKLILQERYKEAVLVTRHVKQLSRRLTRQSRACWLRENWDR